MMGLICKSVPAVAVTLPMRPPFTRYSRVSTEKKGWLPASSWGTRRSVSSSHSIPLRMSSASWRSVIPMPRDPLRESYTLTGSIPRHSSPMSRTRL